MADIKDMSQAIHAALEEIGVTGELNVCLGGEQAVTSIGQPGGDDVAVSVAVHDLDRLKNDHP